MICFKNESFIDFISTYKYQNCNLCIVDPPYNLTNLDFDKQDVIDLFLQQIEKMLLESSTLIIFSQQPFTTRVINSASKYLTRLKFKQELIWSKGKGSNPLLANKRVMQSHENILIFSTPKATYNTQFREGKPYKAPRTGGNRTNSIVGGVKDEELKFKQKDNDGKRYPLSVLDYSIHCGSKRHPTEKPLELIKFLIQSYSNGGDIVSDLFVGSGTTIEACQQTNRFFVGCELDSKYFEIAKQRCSL